MHAAPLTVDRQVLGQISVLRIATPRTASGRRQAERPSRARGGGLDFADHRAYQPGDDLRRVDWRAFARLETVLVRLFHEDRNLGLHVHVDASTSMAFGEPRKADVAATLAATLACLAVRRRDRVTVAVDGAASGRVSASAEPGLARVIGLLERTLPAGRAALGLRPGAGPGHDHAVLISDLLLPSQRREQVLRTHAASAQHGTVVHVLSEAELAPELQVGLECEDAETGARVTLSGGDLERRYAEALDRYFAEVRASCRRYGLRYALVSTATPIAEVVRETFVEAGLVESRTGGRAAAGGVR